MDVTTIFFNGMCVNHFLWLTYNFSPNWWHNKTLIIERGANRIKSFCFKVFGPWAQNRVGARARTLFLVAGSEELRAREEYSTLPAPVSHLRRTAMRSPAAASAVAGSGTDFPDALPSPASPASTSSHPRWGTSTRHFLDSLMCIYATDLPGILFVPSPGRHYYLAVDRTQFKMVSASVSLPPSASRRCVWIPLSRMPVDWLCPVSRHHWLISLDSWWFIVVFVCRGHSWSSWALFLIAVAGCRLQYVFPPVMSLMLSVLRSPTSPLCQCHPW
jgi:hypothetical protein